MSNRKNTNTYDVSRDRILAAALVVHLDDATGQEMSGPGEGVSSFAILLRSMTSEDGVPGPARVAISTAFVSKGSANSQTRWVVGEGGKCSLQTHPAAGAMCIGAGIGRESPHVAAALYGKAAAFAAKCAAALAKRAKAA